jgi:AhpD family alkylhydroperoxidase
MSNFQTYTIDNAPAASKASLEGTKRAFGFVPNLQAYMAESPELLAGYSALWDLFSKSTLTPHEQQVVYLTSNFENGCHYCMAGHSTLAKMIKMDPAVIDALRAGTALPDAKLEALEDTQHTLAELTNILPLTRCRNATDGELAILSRLHTWRALRPPRPLANTVGIASRINGHQQ